MDYHIPNQQIADWSHQIKISLNASTITAQDVQELEEAKADFTQLEAWQITIRVLRQGLTISGMRKKTAG